MSSAKTRTLYRVGGLAVLAVWLLVMGLSIWLSPRPAHSSDKECGTPLFYKIGQVDPKFGLDQKDVRDAVDQASHLWNISTKKQLFVYNEDAQITVNFLYDDRQQAQQLRAAADMDINRSRVVTGAIKENIGELQAQYDKLKSQYDTEKSSLEEKFNDYNRDIAVKNSSGDWSTFDREFFSDIKIKLMEDQRDLNIKANELDALQLRLNELIDQYNSSVKNERISVSIYNADARKRFLAGEFIRKNDVRTINIYEFNSVPDLITILAHEFGHAVGLKDNNDSISLMAGVRETGSPDSDQIVKPSMKDVANLNATCMSENI